MNVKIKVLTAGVLFFVGAEVVSAQKKKTDTTGTKNIEEVIVVAFGKQKKETIVGSNAQIKADKLQQRSITNVAQALDGAAPGIQIATSTGQPGSSPSVRIRGFNSITAGNAPLYIVDGIVFNNALASLNTEDIETINVLKDASSVSLYGSSAANGVVMITTKKGKKGKTSFTFNATTGFSERAIPQYNRLDAAQYYPIVWEAIRNGRLASNSLANSNLYATNELINILKQNVYNVADNTLVVDGVLNPNAKLKYTDLDWDKEVAKKGFRKNYDMSFSGGGDKFSYFASLGYLNESGYIIKSDIERFTGRLNMDSQVKDWLKLGLNIFASNSFGNNAVDGADNASSLVNPYYFSRRMGPIYSPYLHNADGTNVLDADGNKVYDTFQTRGGDAYSGRHTIQENLLNLDYTKNYNVNSRFNIDVKILPELTFTSTVGYDTRNYFNRTYVNKIVGDAAPAGAASRTSTTTQTINAIQLLNYKKTLSGHTLDLMAGHESYKLIYEYFYARKQGQVTDGNDDLVNFITPTSVTSYTDNYKKEGFFGRINYDFREKYLLSGSLRRDGSSKFSSDTRWETFWSAGAGWRINKEEFISGLGFVNELKLRGSYGEVGNDTGIDYYAYQSLFSLGNNNANEAGVILSQVADRYITWESNSQSDLGLDFGFLNNRISGTVEVYRKKTDGLLLDVRQSLSLGIPENTITRNVASLKNEGIEFQLNVSPLKTENYSLDFFVNATRNLNTITKMPEDLPEYIDGSKKLAKGRSIYDFWLRQWYGVNPANGDGLFYLDDALITTPSSQYDYQLNGAWVTTNSSRAKLAYSGTAMPNWFGSFGVNFKFKNFTLNTLFTYQIGGKVLDGNYSQLMSGYAQGIALHTDILDRWQKPGDVTNVPRLDPTYYVQYSSANSTRWLIDAGYINFRSATLSYNFNPQLLRDYGMSALKIFVNGENIWANTARKGMDPAESFTGTTVNRYSPARIFSLGLNVSF